MFADSLRRLRASLAPENRRGRDADTTVVNARDLRELLEHFDRLDHVIRQQYAESHPHLSPP